MANVRYPSGGFGSVGGTGGGFAAQPPYGTTNPAPTYPYKYDWSYFNQANKTYNPTDWYGKYNSIWTDVMGKLNANAGAGLGLYDSGLLGNLTTNLTADVNNPGLGYDKGYANMLYGSMQDQIAAQKPAMSRNIADTYSNPRLSGLGLSALQNMELGLSGQSANAARDVYLANQDIMRTAKQQAIANALGLEQMKGGFYESSKDREIKNLDSYNALLGALMSGQLDAMKLQEAANKGAYDTNLSNLLALGDKYNSLMSAQQTGWQDYLNRKNEWDWWNKNYGGTNFGSTAGVNLGSPGSTINRRWGGGVNG